MLGFGEEFVGVGVSYTVVFCDWGDEVSRLETDSRDL